MKFHEMTARETAEGIKKGDFSASEAVKASFDRMKRMEPALNAVVTSLEENALASAAETDSKRARGEELGPLAGVPVIAKDNMCTRNIRTTCGSRMLEKWKPPYSATVVDLLEASGAILVGKSNMDEFAMGSSTEHSAFGPTSNPWDTDRVPGGSSGGSAAAVAAGYVPLALGSDTGGSIRQPAAFCGVYGLKPTYGLVSRRGLVAFASSLDQIGPLARSVDDLALAMDVIAAPDSGDSTCFRDPRPVYSGAVPDVAGKRVGLVREFGGDSLDPEIDGAVSEAAASFEKRGAEIVELSLPNAGVAGIPCYYILAPAEASSNLARYDGVRYGLKEEAPDLISQFLATRKAGFGPEVKRRILTGTFVLSSGYYDAYYLLAQNVRRALRMEFEKAFEKADVILMPTAPSLPFRKGELVDDPIRMYMTDLFTLPVNLAELPGIAMNTGYARNGLPVGVQLVAPRFGEKVLFGFAAALEEASGRPSVAGGGEMS
ncbi:MAG: Asp-tRNA(Asn)/Glu-tRNA(Gln) amidotransferase subunit GatA [Synergistota bacterium]|nr:Asp-tRNA(Asn)/Glu-tRNA(Gln) amidotransferase subunit GatA [Synergistota bacterium]